ncbi:MAG: DUF58 domain-containing protein [Eubacterium sp.]|nr:DUF58 domain-containing protein [Eubacterium sp.]
MESLKKRNRRLGLPHLLYLLILIAAIILVSNRGGAFSYTLFYTVLCYPVLAFFYLLFLRAGLRIHQEISTHELKKKAAASYQLTLENAGVLPAAGIRLYTYEGRSSFGEDMTGQELTLFPHEVKEFTTTLRCLYSGSYPAGISLITFRDPFHLIRLSLKIPSPLSVQVLPGVRRDLNDTVARIVLQMIQGAAGSRQTERDMTLGNDLRSYMPGDPLKQIHWKNYARSGELFVRLPEEKELQIISVLLFSKKGNDSPEDLSRRDRFLELAVSVAAFFAEKKRPVQFFYYNAGVKKILVEDYEGLQRFSREISRELILRDDALAAEAGIIKEAERHPWPMLTLKEDETAIE